MRPNLMATSSMTPLSRTAAPRSPEETVEAGVLASQQSRFVAADDDDKDKDKKKDDEKKDSKSKKAAEDDDEDKKKKDDDKKDSKSKKAAEDDDEDKKKKKDDAKAILAAERARMLAIIDSPAGKASFAANPEKTLRFVLMHSGSPEEAIATLELFGGNLQSTSKVTPLRERMENVKVEVGQDAAGGPANETAAIAQAIIMAGKKRRGEID